MSQCCWLLILKEQRLTVISEQCCVQDTDDCSDLFTEKSDDMFQQPRSETPELQEVAIHRGTQNPGSGLCSDLILTWHCKVKSHQRLIPLVIKDNKLKVFPFTTCLSFNNDTVIM